MTEIIRETENWNNLSSYEQEDPAQKIAKKWLTKEDLVELSRIKPWRWIVELAITWTLIIAALQFTVMSRSPIAYIAAFFFIGCLQNALIQWRHEASHFSLTRNKKLNDLLGDVFIAGPVGTTISTYRYHHVVHHMYLNDPEKEVQSAQWICLRGSHLLAEVVNHLVGWSYAILVYAVVKSRKQPTPKQQASLQVFSLASIISFLIVNVGIFALCALQGAWYAYFILWVIPPFTVAQLINNFRTIVEHQPSSDVCDIVPSVKMTALTRVIRANPIERWLIAPVGFYYHHEHHAWPSIPYHRLGETRKLLKQRGYFDQDSIIYTEGYLKTVYQLAFQPEYGLRILNPFFDVEALEDELGHGHA